HHEPAHRGDAAQRMKFPEEVRAAALVEDRLRCRGVGHARLGGSRERRAKAMYGMAETTSSAEPRHRLLALALLLTARCGSGASPRTPAAADKAGSSDLVRAAFRALELGADAGYSQPLGWIAGGRPASSYVGPGFGAGALMGYRISPRVSVAAAGDFHES